MRLLIAFTTLIASALAGLYEYRDFRYHGPPAPLASDGTVMDTPEVVSARAAHLAMHAEAVARLKKMQNAILEKDEMMMAPKVPEVTEMPELPAPMMPKRGREKGSAPLGRDGRVVDTAEVAEAKAAHMAAHARAAAKASEVYEADVYDGRRNLVYLTPWRVTYKPVAPVGYTGPFAPLSPEGRVMDTPEVTRAREAHMKAHARAVALATQDVYY